MPSKAVDVVATNLKFEFFCITKRFKLKNFKGIDKTN